MPSVVPTSYPTAVYVSGQLKVAGISLDAALEYKEVFVVALAAIAGVSEEKVTVLITAARRRLAVEIAAAMAVAADSRRGLADDVASGRRRLSGGVNVEYTITVDAASATAASESLAKIMICLRFREGRAVEESFTTRRSSKKGLRNTWSWFDLRHR